MSKTTREKIEETIKEQTKWGASLEDQKLWAEQQEFLEKKEKEEKKK